MLTKRLLRATELSLLVVLLALAGYLRLANHADNPGWYTDETTHIDIARHLPTMQYMAIKDSTLLFARPPLFQLVLAVLLRIFPNIEAIVVLRSLTGWLGVGSVLLVYMLVCEYRWLALWAAFLLAIYPQAVVYSRFGFSYNLVAPLILLVVFGLSRRRWWLAGLALGLAVVTDVIALSFVLPVVIAVIVFGRSSASPLRIVLCAVLVVGPFAVYAVVMLVHAPAAFLFDLSYTLSRLAPSTSLVQQIETLTTNFKVLFGQVGWMLMGAVGLLALPARLRWLVLLMFGVPLVSIGRTVPLYSLSAYYLIPLLPFVPLGVAALAWRVGQVIEKISARPYRHINFVSGIVVSVLLVGLAVPTVKNDIDAVEGGFATSIDTFLINPNDARAVAEYINAQPDAVVIASPPVGWMLEANAADFQMAVAAEGRATPHLPGDVPVERWAFDPRFEAARFVVIDPLWTRWGVIHVPTLADRLHEVETTWSLVFEAGEIRIYSRLPIAAKSFQH